MALWMAEDEDDLHPATPLCEPPPPPTGLPAADAAAVAQTGAALESEEEAPSAARARLSAWMEEDEDFLAELDTMPLPAGAGAPPAASAEGAAPQLASRRPRTLAEMIAGGHRHNHASSSTAQAAEDGRA